MSTFTADSNSYEHLFRAGSQELLPATRDAYLRGALPAAAAAAVEAVLRQNAVERGVVLGRSHELSLLARRQRPARAFVPPAWVQSQLLLQPSVSAWGPLRRPSMQLALGLLLALVVASGVQWVRNKPLIPEPVVASLKQATRTLSRATQQLVSSAPLPAETAADSTSWLALAPRTPAPRPAAAAGLAAAPPPAAALAPIDQLEPAAVATVLSTTPVAPDSAVTTGASPLSETSPAASASAAAPVSPATLPAGHRLVRGHVVDQRGRPLAGATVLVKGTGQATSTNANGEYRLEAPVGAELLVGYGGYADQVLTAVATTDALDVTLEPVRGGRRGATDQL